MDLQQKLLQIVQTWNISKNPQYRRFRCGNCQNLLKNNVWHYQLNSGGFSTLVHLCNDCETSFNFGILKPLTCDKCGINLEIDEEGYPIGYHVWENKRGINDPVLLHVPRNL